MRDGSTLSCRSNVRVTHERRHTDGGTVVHDPAEIVLRPLNGSDDDVVRQWLRRREIAAWWGGLAAGEAETRLAASSDSAVCRMIVLHGMTIGYGHALDSGLLGGARPAAMTPGTYEIVVVIAEPEKRRIGAGGAALRLLSDEVFATTLAPAAALMLPIRHEGAVRAAERAGFSWVSVWDDPVRGACWVMVRGRP